MLRYYTYILPVLSGMTGVGASAYYIRDQYKYADAGTLVAMTMIACGGTLGGAVFFGLWPITVPGLLIGYATRRR